MSFNMNSIVYEYWIQDFFGIIHINLAYILFEYS